MAKKLLSGQGWSFEPAGRANQPESVSLPPEKQKGKIALEKRPKGKEATVLSGFTLSNAERKILTTALKKACGSGGSDAGGNIEIQGDHRQTIVRFLVARGWKENALALQGHTERYRTPT